MTNGPTNEFGREQKDVEGRERTKREMGRSNMHEWARERERERAKGKERKGGVISTEREERLGDEPTLNT